MMNDIIKKFNGLNISAEKSAEKNIDDKIDDIFKLNKYFKLLEIRIKNILLREEKTILTYDILDTEKSKQNKLTALKERQRQMKIGEIWQEVLGSYNGWNNLYVGHNSGLDIISKTKKIIIELKNRTNTDNASSKKANFNKLAIFKQNNPDYRCIYATINSNNEKKTFQGSIKKIIFNNVEIEHHIGLPFIEFILGDDTHNIIDFVKKIIDKYAE